MQWLTAILAFATTMLIFAIIVSTIVETIHRALGSRTYGLVMMLEYFYDEILAGYMNKEQQKKFGKEKFVEEMVRVRGPAVRKSDKADDNSISVFISRLAGLLPGLLKYFYNMISGTSALATKLDKSQWQLLSDLPVITFMERLGSSDFTSVFTGKEISDEQAANILKDIAQKFVAYGQESKLYFERKARTFSVIVAFLVAWTFYVHPETLIQTYLKNPEIAAKVSQMSDGALENLEALETLLETLKKEDNQTTGELTPEQLNKLLADIEKSLKTGRDNSQLLVDAGAPIGWPLNSKSFCVGTGDGCETGIQFNRPATPKDFFWLLMGGLLIGLGAPFWAKAISQIKQGQSAVGNMVSILKPGQVQPAVGKLSVQADDKADDTPITTEAFKVAAVATVKSSEE